MRKKKHEREPEPGARLAHIFQVVLWSLLFMTQVFLLHCLRTEAAGTAGQQEELEIVSELYDSSGDCPVPAETYTDENGQNYVRKHWETVPVCLPAKRITAEQEQIFEQVEGMTAVPETVKFPVQEPEQHRRGTAVCRMESQEVLREWWSSEFSFPVQFHSYDADYYQIGGQLIPFDGEQPQLDGYEDVLLDLIGAPAESYRITDIRWNGEEYPDESGILCRNAVASGEKLLRDYRVSYRGEAKFPEEEKWQTVTVYSLLDEKGAIEPEIPSGEPQPEETAVMPEASRQREADKIPFWKQLVRVVTVVFSLLIPVALFLLFLLVKERKTWYTKQKEHNRNRRKKV